VTKGSRAGKTGNEPPESVRLSMQTDSPDRKLHKEDQTNSADREHPSEGRRIRRPEIAQQESKAVGPEKLLPNCHLNANNSKIFVNTIFSIIIKKFALRGNWR